MKGFKDYIKEDKEEILIEMANYFKRFTDYLPVNIYISSQQGQHSPRIKIQKNYSDNFQPDNMFSMLIPSGDIPEDFDTGDIKKKDIEYFKRFIDKNKEVLLDYWYYRIQTDKLNEKLKFNV